MKRIVLPLVVFVAYLVVIGMGASVDRDAAFQNVGH
jgi:hypothetical protein